MVILLWLLLIFCFVGFIVLVVIISRLQHGRTELERHLRVEAESHETTRKQLEAELNALETKNKRLQKWTVVADADAAAEHILQKANERRAQIHDEGNQILKNAQARADALTEKAKSILSEADSQSRNQITEAERKAFDLLKSSQAEAGNATSEARARAKEMREQAQAALNAALLKAAEINKAAVKRAEEIAGSAYDAMRNADNYEKIAKAMKNLIEGYGDEYLVPAHSLLDDLVEEFSHTQAGQELKAAREHSKVMVTSGTAADCDYAENARRETAVRFVLFAFNGEVENILSRVKHDNYGKLEQEIKDHFVVINRDGQAFRNARVTGEYLDSRLNELKWAAITHQLKLEQQEEQRKIREQMREEEKARRDFERALRETAKEEETLTKAIAKAQLQAAAASEAQRAQYEQQLAELTSKLQVAEERGRRALSMAQQTKRGYVYIISNVGSFGEDAYKIGLTRRLDPMDRIYELGDASVPFEFDVHAMILSEDAPALETQLHKHFVLLQMNKVNHRKEFFRVQLSHIRREVEKLGLEVRWTMIAQAAEYRETMAIERMIKDDPAAREAWLNRQLTLDPVSPQEMLALAE